MDMTLPLEETNLAGIGSDEDKALKEAAAKLDFHWEGAGQRPGLEIWRIENKRGANDTAQFGINIWPKKKYGQFYRGDSYIVLLTTADEESGAQNLQWDIFFWIGSESSQDEYGVAAYKANELDDLLRGAPVQHREVEGHESDEFMECFPKGITYLDGGVDSGFRKVDGLGGDVIKRLYRIHKKPGNNPARCFEVPLKCSSLNDGDAFLLDAGEKIYTWFGTTVSAFEKNKSASLAHNLHENRLGHCECVLDVDDNNEEFWKLLGGKGKIKPADDSNVMASVQVESKMYILLGNSGKVYVQQVQLSRDKLNSDGVCLIDVGKNVYVWVGKGSGKSVRQQAILIVNRYLKAIGRDKATCVTSVNEGRERRCRAFLKVF